MKKTIQTLILMSALSPLLMAMPTEKPKTLLWCAESPIDPTVLANKTLATVTVGYFDKFPKSVMATINHIYDTAELVCNQMDGMPNIRYPLNCRGYWRYSASGEPSSADPTPIEITFEKNERGEITTSFDRNEQEGLLRYCTP